MRLPREYSARIVWLAAEGHAFFHNRQTAVILQDAIIDITSHPLCLTD